MRKKHTRQFQIPRRRCSDRVATEMQRRPSDLQSNPSSLPDLPLDITTGHIVPALPDMRSLLALAQVNRTYYRLILGDLNDDEDDDTTDEDEMVGRTKKIIRNFKDNHVSIVRRHREEEEKKEYNRRMPRIGLEEFLNLLPLVSRHASSDVWFLRTASPFPDSFINRTYAWMKLIRKAERFLAGREESPSGLLSLGSQRYTDRFLLARPVFPTGVLYGKCVSYPIFLLQSPTYLIDLATAYSLDHHLLFSITLLHYLRYIGMLPSGIRTAMRHQTRDYVRSCADAGGWRGLDPVYLYHYLLVDRIGLHQALDRIQLQEELSWIFSLCECSPPASDLLRWITVRWSLYAYKTKETGGCTPQEVSSVLTGHLLNIPRDILTAAFPRHEIGERHNDHLDTVIRWDKEPVNKLMLRELYIRCLPDENALLFYKRILTSIADRLYPNE